MTPAVIHKHKEIDPYFDLPGLSQSGMKDLAVSPLRFWHLHLNPNRPKIEPTPAMELGSALHCAVLESEEVFESRYSCELDTTAFPNLLDTMEELRGWLKSKGVTPKGTRKDEVIAQIDAHPDRREVEILQTLQRRHFAANQGKVIFGTEDYFRLARMADTVRSEPRMNEILSSGKPEVAMTAVDPETGVLLKMRADWVTPRLTLDLKTFSQTRGKSIDKTIADAIFYEGYYRQAAFYTWIRELNGDGPLDFIECFIESEEPHETRLKVFRPKTGSTQNIYWLRAMNEIRRSIRTVAEHMDRFGPDKPWRSAQEIEPLVDEDISQLAFA